MSSLSIDEKMLLIQKMRSQSAQKPNAYIREHSRYQGEPTLYQNGYSSNSSAIEGEIPEETADVFRSLKLRFFVCLILFACFFGMYKADFKIKGHKVTEVNAVLQENMLPKPMQDSLETISQKLTESQTQ